MSAGKSIINQWMESADHDLGSAKLIYLHLPQYYDMIAFHCQQAVEKYIKAVLVFYDHEFQKTHNLIYLLDILSGKEKVTEDVYDKAILLNGFSVQIRYPEKIIFLTREELETAILIADFFREFAIKHFGSL